MGRVSAEGELTLDRALADPWYVGHHPVTGLIVGTGERAGGEAGLFSQRGDRWLRMAGIEWLNMLHGKRHPYGIWAVGRNGRIGAMGQDAAGCPPQEYGGLEASDFAWSADHLYLQTLSGVLYAIPIETPSQTEPCLDYPSLGGPF